MTVLLQCQERSETKDQMIGLLGENFPLTAQKLYNLMKKRYLTAATYHAVYKQLKELVAKGVVVKDGTEYRLSEEWIKNRFLFMESVKAAYGINELNAQSTDGIESTCMACTSYGTLQKLIDEYRNRFLKDADPKKDNRILWLGNHIWAPFVSPAARISMINEIREKNVKYCLAVRGDTKLDKFTKTFYKKAGVRHVKIGIKLGGNETITIYNDTMFYIVFPEESIRILDRLYERSSNIADFNHLEFNKSFLSSPMPFMLFVIKRPEVVNYYAEKIESLFNGS